VRAVHVRAARPGRRTSGRPPPTSRSPRSYQPGPASTAIIALDPSGTNQCLPRRALLLTVSTPEGTLWGNGVLLLTVSIPVGPVGKEQLASFPIRVFLERPFVGRVDTEDAAAAADFGHDEFFALL